jgi:hypothetical protein
MGRTTRFLIKVSRKGSNDTRKRKILVFPLNFTTFDLGAVFIFPGMAGAAGGISLPPLVATDL